MNFGDPTYLSAFSLEQLFTQAACPFDSIIIGDNQRCKEAPSTINFGKYKQNLPDRNKKHEKRVIRVMRVIEQILLLP